MCGTRFALIEIPVGEQQFPNECQHVVDGLCAKDWLGGSFRGRVLSALNPPSTLSLNPQPETARQLREYGLG